MTGSRGNSEMALRELRKQLASKHSDHKVLSNVFQSILRLVATEHSGRHEALRLLASNDGLGKIDMLLTSGMTSGYSSSSVTSGLSSNYFRDRFVPLFDTLSNHHVLSSFVMEQYRDQIFGFMYGPAGKRLEKLLLIVTKNLHQVVEDAGTSAASSSSSGSSSSSPLSQFESALAVVFHIVELNGAAQIQPRVVALVEDLASAVELALNHGGQPHGCDSLKHMSRIQERLGVGQSIPKYTASQHTFAPASFHVTPDLPGTLSSIGPRHNNDYEDICDISILPTLEEIRSIRSEYLPTTDRETWHREGVAGLIDRHFRLLREDTVGQLRDGIRIILEDMETPPQAKKQGSQRRQVLRMSVYQDVKVEQASVNRPDGLRLDIAFQQPAHLRTLSAQKRKDWWAKKRLLPDAFVCLISGHGTLLFCSVFEDAKPAKAKEKGTLKDLHSNPGRAFVTLKLCSSDASESDIALNLLHSDSAVVLVEFPGVLLPAFQHTLVALQKMSQSLDLPFSDVLSRGVATDETIPPPLYTQKPNFRYTLQGITRDNDMIWFMPGSAFDMEALVEKSFLDPAVVDALSRSFSLIQGPPGTGKSYTGVALIRVLLDSREAGDLGPIICVCYTNHALDQLLEHLLDSQVSQIIRVGSQSKSERIASLNLIRVMQGFTATKVERERLGELSHRLKNSEAEITQLLHLYSATDYEAPVSYYLQINHPFHYGSLFRIEDEEGFQTVVRDRQHVLHTWAETGSEDPPHTTSSIDVLHETPIDRLSRAERRALILYWCQEAHEYLHGELCRLIEEHQCDRAEHDRIRSEVKLRCLQGAKIIGITTSGLARNLELLRRIRCKVLLCEEAGEVLEAHMLTALLPSVEHTILVGDHLQLRPQVQRYELSSQHPHGVKYSLDLSLFERLAKSQGAGTVGLPLSTLETQRRMHPSISRLIRDTLYPALQDDLSVASYPPVIGMKHRLLWLHHTVYENGVDQQDATNTSHTNDFEVGMTAALASHLLRQGSYEPGDIAVLTPYLGQLHKLRSVLGGMFELVLTDLDEEALEEAGLDPEDEDHPRVSKVAALQALKVATIDNFQGEEAKVVIISLVRSNAQNMCGFLRTSNRINVLLSRAQHGMYIIGNAETAGSVQMWHDVIGMLEEQGLVQSDLELQCPRHPSTVMKVRDLDGFQSHSPEGGCDRRCDKRLKCGHACMNKCHSPTIHDAVVCLAPCSRSRKTCDHSCTRPCGERCLEDCPVDVYDPDRILPCGHKKVHVACWQSQNMSRYQCDEGVRRIVPGCQHTVNLPCSVKFDSDEFECTAVCGARLNCGHTCNRKCHECKIRVGGVVKAEEHRKCVQLCKRNFTTCRHQCKQQCHDGEPCALCESACDVSCSHSKCHKKCHEPCRPCAQEHCASRCPHSRCTLPCAAPCDWTPCHRRCQEVLKCGHQCPTLCGEICPSEKFCQVCCSDGIKAQVVDFLEMKTYGEMDLNDEPCVIPKCGHIMAASSMDGHMNMSEYYQIRSDGSIASISPSAPFSADDAKTCPTCRGSLRNMARYGRIVRRSLLDESTKKFIVWSNRRMIDLSEAFNTLQEEMADNFDELTVANLSPIQLKLTTAGYRGPLVKAAKDLLIYHRYEGLFSLRTALTKFTHEVQTAEQPFIRVRDLCEDARRRRHAIGVVEVDPGILQTRCHLDAVALSTRCELAIIADLINVVRKKVPHHKIHKLTIDLHLVRQSSGRLIREASAVQRVGQQVEGYMFQARCAVLERIIAHEGIAADGTDGDKDGRLRAEATTHLELARRLCEQHPGSTRGLLREVEEVEAALHGSAFYNVVTSDERRAVLRAMATEFTGTGHWYECRNGHPFTVGECGGPMVETRCTECDAPVGGRHHRAAEGVQQAEGLERELRELSLAP